MIDVMDESSGAVVGVRASGRLTDADYRNVLIPHLEKTLAEHGKLRLLCLMDSSFEGWDLDAAWDDASFALRHRTDFEKMAVVGGPKWVETCIRFTDFLWKGEIRCYPAEKLDDAWAWVKS